MKQMICGWRHLFKLDPDRSITDEALKQICQSGTHAIMVGGSSGITYNNTADLLKRIRHFSIQCVLEISNQEAIVPGFDLYFIPVVLNTKDAQWIVGHHQQAIKQYGILIPWDRVITEGYVILNEHSTVASLSHANTKLGLNDVLSYAELADKMFRFNVFYMEYSGTFGDMSWVKQTASLLQEARLFYGGGIDSLEKARLAAQAAHTIVVGNVIYDNLQQALETVKVINEK